MDRETKIDLGSYNIASYLDERFVLVASTSLTLRLPEQYSSIRTAADIHENVKRGKLWAMRASSCRLELCLHFETSVAPPDEVQDTLVAAFETCPVWEALGLQLRRETSTNEFTLAPGALHTYYLQHVSEHSALITPTGVPCVYISTWHCDFSFVSKPAPTCFVGAEVTRPKILSKIVTLKLQPKKLRRFAKRKQFLSHTTARQQRRQSVVQRRTAPTVPPAKLSDHVTATEEPEFCSLPLHMQYKRLEHLMYAALSSVLGLRRKLVDIRIKHSQALTLVDIAPTVFNTLHLQGVVTRLQSTSIIASALSSLASTQSPILRQKILDLQLHQNTQPLGALEAIQQRLDSLVLRSTTTPKIRIQTRIGTVVDATNEGVFPDGPLPDIGSSLTPCYNALMNGDVDTGYHQEWHESHEADSLTFNEFGQPDYGTSISELDLSTGDPPKRYSGFGAGGLEPEYIDEDSDSAELGAQIHYRSDISESDTHQLDDTDNISHIKHAAPYYNSGCLERGSQQYLPDFESIYEGDSDEDMYVQAMNIDHRSDSMHFNNSRHHIASLCSEASSAELCGSQKFQDEHYHEIGDEAMTFYDGSDQFNSDERKSVCNVSGHSSDFLNHDCMCPVWYGSATMEDILNMKDVARRDENETAEDDADGLSISTIKEETPGTSESQRSDQELYAPERYWSLDDLRASQYWI